MRCTNARSMVKTSARKVQYRVPIDATRCLVLREVGELQSSLYRQASTNLLQLQCDPSLAEVEVLEGAKLMRWGLSRFRQVGADEPRERAGAISQRLGRSRKHSCSCDHCSTAASRRTGHAAYMSFCLQYHNGGQDGGATLSQKSCWPCLVSFAETSRACKSC